MEEAVSRLHRSGESWGWGETRRRGGEDKAVMFRLG